MASPSPKLSFMNRPGDDQDHFDNLIRTPPSKYRPHEVGSRFHRSLAQTKVNRGGLGSGKTRMMTEQLYALGLQYPGAVILIGRYDLPALKATTQKEFLEQVVQPETVHQFNVNENILYLKNRTEFRFIQTKTPADFKSWQILAYGLDEADENPTNEIWSILDDRLRQPIVIDGETVNPPYQGILTFNPTSEEHWLYDLAQRRDISVEDFQSSTYDNIKNLPPHYIPNLIAKLPPWEISRLVHGNWGRQIKGKPVYHGFTVEKNVRPLKLNPQWPLYRGWDFGFNRPAVRWMQIDPMTGRCFLLREFLGREQYLSISKDKPSVIDEVKRITAELGVGPSFPIFDYCDPHGADKKDNAESSVETLRLHYGIVCRYQRSEIKTGMDEVQNRIITEIHVQEDGVEPKRWKREPLWLVDHSCKVTISAYCGAYYRDEFGLPYKDGYYDHLCDVDRYVIVNTMGLRAHARAAAQKKYQPRNRITGY